MNKEQAIEVLIKAAEAANKSGAFTLQDAAYVANAIAIINQPAPAPDQNLKGKKQ